MRIALISDIHDHRSKLKRALEGISEADLLICLGDLCSPFIIKDLGEGFSGPIHIVFGNNDGDLFRITETAKSFDHIMLHGEIADLMLDGKRIAITHFDTVARMLATSDFFDLICFGHNHTYEVSKVGNSLLVNPGEIMGEISGISSYAIYSTSTHNVERITLSDD
ncbi:MAG: YfcE family phosphodiesterase [Calditrichota bacterium]